MGLPKLVITDIDGVWTDGGMYYDGTGNELKKFNTSDSAGVLFLRTLNIPLAIVTGEDTIAVRNRAKKLKIDLAFFGVKNKVAKAEVLCQKLKIQISEIAYIGDDLNDIFLLDKVGYSGCPANAPDYVKSRVKIITQKSGGEGAFREFVEHLLKENNVLESTIQKVLYKEFNQ